MRSENQKKLCAIVGEVKVDVAKFLGIENLNLLCPQKTDDFDNTSVAVVDAYEHGGNWNDEIKHLGAKFVISDIGGIESPLPSKEHVRDQMTFFLLTGRLPYGEIARKAISAWTKFNGDMGKIPEIAGTMVANEVFNRRFDDLVAAASSGDGYLFEKCDEIADEVADRVRDEISRRMKAAALGVFMEE